MREAYLATIRDFEIAIYNTDWWRFREIHRLQKLIVEYEKNLNR